ncbi:CGNR zinc finger domain-containing protein [Herbiconiux sp. YIM B11900]|uniref:CGNR zinc finger domain-containing protein n=1 Tax=Herbiconiux sp. YIM B11900 TaxID=3404131 RepID=UPI003F828343
MDDSSLPTVRSFSAIAGHLALDLVNTVHWRLSGPRWIDTLESYDAVVAWARQFDLVDDEAAGELRRLAGEDPDRAAQELDRVRALREGLYSAVYSAPAADPSPPRRAMDDRDLIAAEYADAITSGRLSSPGEKAAPWAWDVPADLSLPRHRIAFAAVDLLTSAAPGAYGQCADDECGWVFLDSSPRHNRRWCVSADCGNRNRVRRYNERARASDRSAP